MPARLTRHPAEADTAAPARNGTEPPVLPPAHYVMWADMSQDERLEIILRHFEADAWSEARVMDVLIAYRDHPRRWFQILARAQALKLPVSALERAIDACLHRGGTAAEDATGGFDPFAFVDAAAMQAMQYPPPAWLIPGLIANGLTILGGSPKSGKSYLAYALALAVCRPALWCGHWHAAEGPVTFVSLEDDEADSAGRLQELLPHGRIPPGRLRFIHGIDKVPSFGQGFIAWVGAVLAEHRPRLLVIDPISYLYALKRTGNQFEETKDMLFPLRWLGKQHGCAIVCVDHRRKQSRDDVSIFDTLHGSVAKIAVADSLLMVQRDDADLTIAALVRRGKDQTLNLTLTFTDHGEALLAYRAESKDTLQYGQLRQQILTFMRGLHLPVSVPDIVLACDFVDTKTMRDTIKKILLRAEKAREIERTMRGKYIYVMGEEA